MGTKYKCFQFNEETFFVRVEAEPLTPHGAPSIQNINILNSIWYTPYIYLIIIVNFNN